jgi:hypothetical protein
VEAQRQQRAVKRALLAACVLAAVAPAVAGAATLAQVRALAREAQTDPATLARLRAVTDVDGRPFVLARALRTDDPAALRARLMLLAGRSESASNLGAKSDARAILAERRFHGSAVPRPLHRPLAWLGARFRPLTHLVERLGRLVPGGSASVWVVLALLVVGAAVAVGGRTARRRDAALFQDGRRAPPFASVEPWELERLADLAEASGDAATALRLRFRAGLLRLGRAHVVPLRESLTSGEARRLVALDEFDRLARVHDEVVYGGRVVHRADAEAAREGWPRVLAAKGVRA